MSRLVLVFVLCAFQTQAGADDARLTQVDPVRYAQIQRLINDNRHLSAHLVFAVDARTTKVVRRHISESDIPVLVQMMGDKDYGVAAAAAGLLVTLGRPAMPVLRQAAGGRNSSIAIHAQDALRCMDDCYNEALADVISSDVCPTDRSSGRAND